MERKKIFYGWWIVLGSILITCTMVPLIMSLSSKFLLQVTEEMNISRSSFTLVNTILQALGIFLSPIVSKRLATGNMRRIQSICIVGFSLAYASYGLAKSVVHLYISGVLVGFFYLNSALIPISMMVTNWFEKKRGLAMSLAMAGIGIGGFIFSPVVTYLLGAFGWRNTYMIMAGIVLVVGLPVALFIFRRKPEDIGLKPYGAEDKDVALAGKAQAAPPSAEISISVKESRTKPFFWLLLAGMLFNGVINSGALGQFPPALEELHGPAVQATIISMYSLIGIFGKLMLGWINDKFGIIISTMFGCVTFAFAFVFMLMGKNVAMVYAMAVVFGMGNAIGTVTPPLIVASIYGSKKYGEAYGITNSITQVGLSVGSLFVASMYDLSGSYNIAWMALLVLTAAALLGFVSSYMMSRKFVEEKPGVGLA